MVSKMVELRETELIAKLQTLIANRNNTPPKSAIRVSIEAQIQQIQCELRELQLHDADVTDATDNQLAVCDEWLSKSRALALDAILAGATIEVKVAHSVCGDTYGLILRIKK